MEGPRECLVSGTLAIVLQASRLVGVAPLQFNKHEGGWRVRLSPGLYKLSCLNITIMGVILTSVMIYNLILLSEQSAKLTQYITMMVQLSWCLCLAGTMVYDAPRRIRTIIECVNKVQEINFQMKNNCSSQEIKRAILFLYVVFISNRVVSFLSYVITFKFTSVRSNILILVSKYVIFVVEMGVIQYIVIVMHITTSFKSINDHLKTLDSSFPGKSADRRFCQKAINQIRAAYESACDMVEQVNESQGLVLMLFIAYSFTQLVVCAYYFFNSINSASQIEDFYFLMLIVTVFKLYWCTFHLINLMMMIEPCHWTYKEMTCTRVLVGCLMRRAHSVSNMPAEELQLFCAQLSLHKPFYRPLAIITIKRSLLIDILSNAITYLVILIHMK